MLQLTLVQFGAETTSCGNFSRLITVMDYFPCPAASIDDSDLISVTFSLGVKPMNPFQATSLPVSVTWTETGSDVNEFFYWC